MVDQEQPPSLSDKDKEFAYQYLSDRESYHCHIVSKICYPRVVLSIIVFLIWLLVHSFMRWQLINRRVAALQVGTLTTALLDYLKMKVNVETNTSNKESKAKKANDFWYYRDYLWPISTATLKSDVDLENYPDWYQKRYIAYQEKGTGAVRGEWFPTIGSFFMLIISLLYVIFILG